MAMVERWVSASFSRIKPKLSLQLLAESLTPNGKKTSTNES
jgi:hypothetical protein